ncbi:conserved hypothetical protein [Trichinella spiralis]|uniref:hypothetical protein n=1 Tax=Trichinella spiralis TaxID=6334 RepID=UPI0001EFBF54|nr:conserved hypothetical protein [Trichinella spiralis]
MAWMGTILNVPSVPQVFTVAISPYRPCAHLPGNFERDLFDQSQPETSKICPHCTPAAFFILYQYKGTHAVHSAHTFEHLQYFCLRARFNLYILPTIPPNWTKSRNDLVQDVTQGTEQ